MLQTRGTGNRERALAAGVEQVVFDRGGYLYHGRVKALTDAARAGVLTKARLRKAKRPVWRKRVRKKTLPPK